MPDDKTKCDCPYCHGTGKVKNEAKEVSAYKPWADCNYCKGTGKVDADDPLAGPGGA